MKRYLIVAAVVIAMLAAHELLAHWMIDADAAGQLLSPGAHTPPHILALALSFVLLRLAVFLLLPALVVGWLCSYILNRFYLTYSTN